MRVRVQLNLEAAVWRAARVAAAEAGISGSDYVERVLVERSRVRLPEIDDQGAPKLMVRPLMAQHPLIREARASVRLDHDDEYGTQVVQKPELVLDHMSVEPRPSPEHGVGTVTIKEDPVPLEDETPWK